MIEEPLTSFSAEDWLRIQDWDDDWKEKIGNIKFIGRLNCYNNCGGRWSISAEPVPLSTGFIHGFLYGLQLTVLLKDNAGLYGSKHEGDTWDLQSHCSDS